MKFLALLFFLTLNLTIKAVSAEIDTKHSSQHYQPGNENWRVAFENGLLLLEKNYESNAREFEEFSSQHLTSILYFDYGLSDEHALTLGIHGNHNGRLKKFYDDDTPLAPAQTKYQGLEKIELSFKSRFTQYLSEGIDQSLVMKIQSGVISAKDQNASMGQTDFIASYLFSFYLPADYEFFGSLHVGYIGKKRKRRIDGETEVSDTYARTSFNVGLMKRFSRFYLSGDLEFGLTTNYNIKSPSYNINSDKGFFVAAKLGLGYETKSYLIELSFMTRSDVFNKFLLENQFLDPSLDYEWESTYSALRVAWLF